RPGQFSKISKCRVRIYFAEHHEMEVGERIFDIYLQDEKVESNLDINAAAGNKAVLIREFDEVLFEDELSLRLESKSGKSPSIAGIEVRF
ncbi:MAG: malectin domain-containing carbohydrate-binding protein, partial [Verrucomicrobiota bacterium]